MEEVVDKLLDRFYNRLYKSVNYNKNRFDDDLQYIMTHSGGIKCRFTFGVNGVIPYVNVEVY